MKRDFEDSTFVIHYENATTITVYNKKTDEDFKFSNEEIANMSMDEILAMCYVICV